MFDITHIVRCPVCKGPCEKKGSALVCVRCAKTYAPEGKVLTMLPGNVTEREAAQMDYYEELYANPAAHEIYDRGIVENYFYELLNERYFFSVLNEKIKPGSIVLDIGCGGGNIARHLHAAPACLINVDISKEALRHAAQFSKGNSCYIQASGFSLPFQDNSFDYVVTYGFLHHIEDLRALLTEVRRVLKPHGLFIAFEPSARYPWLNLWLDYIHMPRFMYARIQQWYDARKKKIRAKDTIAGLAEVIEKDNFQSKKHFFKDIKEYTKYFRESFGEGNITIKAALLEYLPPRFFFIRNRRWVTWCLACSDFLLRNPFFQKRARFVFACGRKSS